jgi:hypothetical protein
VTLGGWAMNSTHSGAGRLSVDAALDAHITAR